MKIIKICIVSSRSSQTSPTQSENVDFQLRELPENHDLVVTDDSSILSKYSENPNLSDKANILIQRKRELILNSKK